MEQEMRDRLVKAGVNVDSGLERFMNNEALFLKFLLRFPGDPNFAQLGESLASGDLKAAFVAAHTLKGVTGNLSLDGLFPLLTPVVEALRREDKAAAEDAMPPLREAYQRVTAILLEN